MCARFLTGAVTRENARPPLSDLEIHFAMMVPLLLSFSGYRGMLPYTIGVDIIAKLIPQTILLCNVIDYTS